MVYIGFAIASNVIYNIIIIALKAGTDHEHFHDISY